MSPNAPKSPAADRFAFTPVSDYQPTCRWNYTVKGLLRRGETSIFYGPSNVGKSALLVHLCLSVAAGKKFFGQATKKGLAVYVAAEAPRSVLDRFAAIKGEFDAEAAKNCLVLEHAVDFSQPGEVTALQKAILAAAGGQPVALIVFDTLARSIGDLSENDSGAMTYLARRAETLARELDAHVLFVHHCGKDQSRGARGSSGLKGAVDTELRLQSGDDNVVVGTIDKQRTMPKTVCYSFGLQPVKLGEDEDGGDYTSVRVVEVDEPIPANAPEKPRPTSRRTVLVDLLEQRQKKQADAPFSIPDLIAELPASWLNGLNDDSQKSTARKLLNELAAAEKPLVKKDGQRWRLA
ncbi:AAA domain-containing protein [Tranquillimonas alkanivorans]|uniref:AAA domain-containing protein n=2 Tax=Tranquillimonas alkanivorans TaxID=441119 RepID=A0A1I5W037_9RHOB|nr:AAA domain-containing protein [Tranquillimonas alkanivorans]